MADYNLLYFIIRVLAGAAAGFCAVLFWPRNRDPAWVLMILGALVLYLHLVFELLLKIRLLVPEYFVIAGFPVFDIIVTLLGAAPYLFFAVGFILMIARK